MHPLTRVSLFAGILCGTVISTAGGCLCYHDKMGWGWFLAAGFAITVISLSGLGEEIIEEEETKES